MVIAGTDMAMAGTDMAMAGIDRETLAIAVELFSEGYRVLRCGGF
jgi:hypothetical protein